jgi:hypothetical protein
MSIRCIMIPGFEPDLGTPLKEETLTAEEAQKYNQMMEEIGKSYTPVYPGEKVIKTPLRGVQNGKA